MIVYPNAKINIGLNITEKLNNGFHSIESIFYPINWCDILEINKSNVFKFTTSGLDIDVDPENNIIIKAYNLIKGKYNISPCKIHLHKIIPMGAGLGGGSADASFTLTVLNNLFNLKISSSELEKLSNVLGSDCPFFIQNTPKFVKGTGEVFNACSLNLNGYYIKLVNPNIHISTKNAFKNIAPKASIYDLSSLTISTLTPKIVFNDFEKSIFPQFPILQKIKDQLLTEGAIFTSMTGTGSTIYGIFKKEPINSFKHFTEKIVKLN